MTIMALGVSEASKSLSIGRTKMYQLINSGAIKTKTVGSRRIVPMSEIERFLNSK